jgi:hypothetical protein
MIVLCKGLLALGKMKRHVKEAADFFEIDIEEERSCSHGCQTL